MHNKKELLYDNQENENKLLSKTMVAIVYPRK